MNILKYIILLGLIAFTCATSIQHRGDTADDDADESPDSGEIPAYLRAGPGGLKSSTSSSDPKEKVKESSSSEEDKKPAAGIGSISGSGIRPRPPVTSAPEVSPLPSGKNNSTFISSIRVQKRAVKDNSTAPGAHFGNSRPSRQAQNVPKPPVRRPAVAQPPKPQVGVNKNIPTPNRRPARAANSTSVSNKPTTIVNSTSISSSKPSSSSGSSRPPAALLTINNPSSSSSSFGKPSSTFIISPSTSSTSNSTRSRQARQLHQEFLGDASETDVEGAEEISAFSSHQTVNSTSPLFVTGIKN